MLQRTTLGWVGFQKTGHRAASCCLCDLGKELLKNKTKQKPQKTTYQVLFFLNLGNMEVVPSYLQGPLWDLGATTQEVFIKFSSFALLWPTLLWERTLERKKEFRWTQWERLLGEIHRMLGSSQSFLYMKSGENFLLLCKAKQSLWMYSKSGPSLCSPWRTRWGNCLIYWLDILQALCWSKSNWTHEENTNPALRQHAAKEKFTPVATGCRKWGNHCCEPHRGFWVSKPKIHYDQPSLTVISLIQKLTLLPKRNFLATLFSPSPRAHDTGLG